MTGPTETEHGAVDDDTDRESTPLPADNTPRPHGKRHLPGWAWLIVASILATAIGLGVLDLRHRHAFRLVCSEGQMTLARGRRFPLPFGFESLSGLYGPSSIESPSSCSQTTFEDRASAETAYLAALIEQAQLDLARPDASNLPAARGHLFKALQITRAQAHRAYRQRVTELIADVAYRQGRAQLAQIEAQLRAALAFFRESQQRAVGRHADLDAWIAQLQRLLHGVAPTPEPDTPLPPTPAEPPVGGAATAPKRPEVAEPPSPIARPADATPPAPTHAADGGTQAASPAPDRPPDLGTLTKPAEETTDRPGAKPAEGTADRPGILM